MTAIDVRVDRYAGDLRTCPCGEAYQPRQAHQRYCSHRCKAQARRDAKRRFDARHHAHGLTTRGTPRRYHTGGASYHQEAAPLLRETCDRLEAQLATVPKREQRAWLEAQFLKPQLGYRDFPWLVRTCLLFKLKLA